jgi:hypothetical protein
MMAFASGLLTGLSRAKARAEAHEHFTLTPVLIGEVALAVRGRLRVWAVWLTSWFVALGLRLRACSGVSRLLAA